MATSTDTQTPVTTAQSSPIIASLHEHVSYTEVVCDPLWQGAMAEELTALHQNHHRWDSVLMPSGKRAIGYHWVYKIRTKSDVSIERYKARLVSKGEVYKLQKDLYGLKQAPRACAGRILFFSYVDDMIIIGDDCDGIELLEAELSHRFDMKELGLLRYFLGIEVASSPKKEKEGVAMVKEKFKEKIKKVFFDDVELMSRGKTLYRTLHPYDVHIVLLHLFSSSTTSLDLRAYYNVDWARDSVTCKSTNGFYALIGDSLISWKSMKQDILSKSYTQGEYHVIAVTTSEIISLPIYDDSIQLMAESPRP
ncbi:uncharacterized mitochondrial protein-like protein [Tanacetum coccineum]